MKPIPQIETSELRERLQNGENIYMIDVREDEEVAAGMISGAKHIPMGEIPARLNEIPKDQEVIFICRSGGRSQHVCEYLSHQGHANVVNMKGGMLQWAADEE
ncbi:MULTISPECIES: rhodanese-like domain-containing protein [Paenibacillus]|uniref:Rhodanese-like domain-containing protein n=1 Tax=Paenibacillus campinasensis TaxID=66347 RepID=A0A268F3S2_9BACL|nr:MULTISPECIES: rhodanese-like domain-containing protein [Paenibacillus]MUG64739.1 rhodanese-like domain-containing protein [Paenibacillus campinasensis]PAD80025.1 sulfurtransferase [Paenibacillus campinasensis]PAK55452.1 sulfurtransferase [Paenibacillus sp. 7541]